jgi:hypothetical protein
VPIVALDAFKYFLVNLLKTLRSIHSYRHVSEPWALARDGFGRVDLGAHGLRQPCLSCQPRLTGLRSA